MSGRVGSGQVSGGADGWCGSVGAFKIKHRVQSTLQSKLQQKSRTQSKFQLQLIIVGGLSERQVRQEN